MVAESVLVAVRVDSRLVVVLGELVEVRGVTVVEEVVSAVKVPVRLKCKENRQQGSVSVSCFLPKSRPTTCTEGQWFVKVEIGLTEKEMKVN